MLDEIINYVQSLQNQVETEKKARIHQLRLEEGAKRAAEELEKYDPISDPNISGDPYKTLFVARLNYETTESRIKREFEAYGPIKRMAKIKAVLDQETWVEVDVPDEFQAITASLYFEEPGVDGDLDDASNSISRGKNETISSNTDSLIADGQATTSVQPIDRTNSTEVPPDY